jgi:hypothetical protein
MYGSSRFPVVAGKSFSSNRNAACAALSAFQRLQEKSTSAVMSAFFSFLTRGPSYFWRIRVPLLSLVGIWILTVYIKFTKSDFCERYVTDGGAGAVFSYHLRSYL